MPMLEREVVLRNLTNDELIRAASESTDPLVLELLRRLEMESN